MQPYQAAAEEIKKQGTAPHRAIATGAGIAATAFTGGLAASKVLPFLSKYIPAGLAIKGLSKIDPRFGSFFKTAMENGKSPDEIKDFIQQKISGDQQNTPDEKNIIQRYSPELNDLIAEMINKGMSPLEAASEVSRSSGQQGQSLIKQMEKEYKTDWYSIVESIFGKGDTAQRGQTAAQPKISQQQPQQAQGNWGAIAEMLKQTLAS